jgi:hypothetical protein
VLSPVLEPLREWSSSMIWRTFHSCCAAPEVPALDTCSGQNICVLSKPLSLWVSLLQVVQPNSILYGFYFNSFFLTFYLIVYLLVEKHHDLLLTDPFLWLGKRTLHFSWFWDNINSIKCQDRQTHHFCDITKAPTFWKTPTGWFPWGKLHLRPTSWEGKKHFFCSCLFFSTNFYCTFENQKP